MTRQKDIEQLFRLHYVSMHRRAVLILHNEDVARDMVHDVFEALLSSGITDVGEGYLLRAVQNRCLNHIRNLSVRDRLRFLYALDEYETAYDDWPDDETMTQIQSTVANDLTDACRDVVSLRFSEGKSYKEIAGTLGVSEVAVYKHLRHAIDVLRKKFSQNG